jgi:hypothetical protein
MNTFLEWLDEKGIVLESVMVCPKCGAKAVTDYGRGPEKVKCRACREAGRGEVEMSKQAERAA